MPLVNFHQQPSLISSSCLTLADFPEESGRYASDSIPEGPLSNPAFSAAKVLKTITIHEQKYGLRSCYYLCLHAKILSHNPVLLKRNFCLDHKNKCYAMCASRIHVITKTKTRISLDDFWYNTVLLIFCCDSWSICFSSVSQTLSSMNNR